MPPQNILHIDSNLTLVGSLHVSPKTKQRVIDTISEIQPDVVAVELDKNRYSKLMQDSLQSLSVSQVLQAIRSGTISVRGGVALLLVNRLRGRVDDTFEYSPGEADMLPAIETGTELGGGVAFIDTEMEEIVDELGSGLIKLVKRLGKQVLTGRWSAIRNDRQQLREQSERVFDGETSEMHALEGLSQDELLALETTLDDVAPELTAHIIHERNQKMAGYLRFLQLSGYSVVAVVGKLHMPGIQRLLAEPSTIPRQYVRNPVWHTPPEAVVSF